MKKGNKRRKSYNNLIKTILVFLCYFLYSQAFTSLFGSSIAVNFIADIIFLIAIVIAYKENLKRAFRNLKKEYSLGKIIKTIILWVVIILVFNMVMGMLTDVLAPNSSLTVDDNTKAVEGLLQISTLYTVFKTMIFAIVAEELLFRESVHDVVSNKWLFILVSSLIYTLANFAYTGFDDHFLVISLLSYFLPALLFSYAYCKNHNNILVLMMIKFVYQLIPLTIMFISA